MKKKTDLEKDGSRINVFEENRGGINDSDEDSDRDLTEEELRIMKDFEENDRELEALALEIC